MPKYEVFAGRHDVPLERVGSFEASNDQAAQEVLRHNYIETLRYEWDDLRLEEVIQERKVRVVVVSFAKGR